MIQAIKWILFQYDLQDKLLLMSYTWKAALLLGDSIVYKCDHATTESRGVLPRVLDAVASC